MKYLIKAAAIAAATLAASAQATVITFDDDSCFTSVCANFDYLNTVFADTGTLDVYTYSTVAPGNTALLDNYARWWDTGYGDLQGVAWGGVDDDSGVPTFVFLSTDFRQSIRFNSLQTAGWPNTDQPTEFRVYDLAFNLIFTTGPVVAPGQGHLDISFGGITRRGGLILQWGPNGYNAGIDNLDFDQLALPEPATWSLMIGGFGMIGGALRRRRFHTA